MWFRYTATWTWNHFTISQPNLIKAAQVSLFNKSLNSLQITYLIVRNSSLIFTMLLDGAFTKKWCPTYSGKFFLLFLSVVTLNGPLFCCIAKLGVEITNVKTLLWAYLRHCAFWALNKAQTLDLLKETWTERDLFWLNSYPITLWVSFDEPILFCSRWWFSP